MTDRLPRELTLPSGKIVKVRVLCEPSARAAVSGSALFSEVFTVLEEDLALMADGHDLRPASLCLRDFHALRGLLAKTGFVAEETIEITCLNCEAAIVTRPCESLPMGPFRDGELNDPELDRTLAFGEPHAIPNVSVPGGVAREVVLSDVTAGEARAFHRALARDSLRITAGIVRSMGTVRLGDEARPDRIARALSRASDAAWDAIGRVFVESHYAPRLAAVVRCDACGARNDVDAPFERELDRGPGDDHEPDRAFPDLDAFAARAEAIFAPLVLHAPEPSPMLIVEDGTPACDDGGDPLLGAYDPPITDASDARPPTVTIFVRTFASASREEPDFDWEDELRETIEHELEHHDYFVRGHDPMDDEERAEIAREEARVFGKRELVRREARSFASDLRGFVSRTWFLWLLVIVAIGIAIAAESR